ncbi:hypothetical protein C9374_004142 [Naegleria lovaniensis]|uniref:PH domain-containing protein n=1 Tax=Naegleria lovaniensis TaxID=51637 RepID=A0AA88GQI7_NAELO|nr:uncharacterized protein C9374_004142 [Naegleria lovaniensis]KAG2383471.1 hypothetical protein C9374_004142 [Naegleria lovaniensis]
MTLSGIDAETKLAEFRFGSPLTCDRLMSEHKPTLTGYLEKKGRLKKNWKKRFFVLLQNYLFYFAKENGKLKGFLRIEECEIEREEEVGSKGLYVFHIKTMGRLLSLRVDNVEDREDWIKWIYENSRVLHE